MEAAKKKRLQTRGWKVGSVAEFLELSSDEAALVEFRLTLPDGDLAEVIQRSAPVRAP